MNIQTIGGPVHTMIITLDDGKVIEIHADSVPVGHGSYASELSYSVSDPSAKV